ncbi:hypothetical protein BRPE64_BCDS11170 [Caballeronia insecticola]|uniref:Surface-adhesin protein E-like domain-containing protein n=2 Tax=Caballeronia insecticola TaxID=758793 RepID=R4WMF7_9BURK|nr:hypothetical protein BRPE64_BCDS11170 [Caballeronia insecticola]
MAVKRKDLKMVGKQVAYTPTHYVYNCCSRRFTKGTMVVYDKSGSSLGSDPASGPTEDVVRGSMSDTQMKIACGMSASASN